MIFIICYVKFTFMTYLNNRSVQRAIIDSRAKQRIEENEKKKRNT